MANNPTSNGPHTNLQMVLNYLKQGHAILPPQPTVQPPAFSSVMGRMPQTPPQS